MQVKVVRHHRRAQDAHRDVEHLGIRQHLRGRDEATGHWTVLTDRGDKMRAETDRNRRHECDDHRLRVSEALVLQQ